jgi:hypothetical protein
VGKFGRSKTLADANQTELGSAQAGPGNPVTAHGTLVLR